MVVILKWCLFLLSSQGCNIEVVFILIVKLISKVFFSDLEVVEF